MAPSALLRVPVSVVAHGMHVSELGGDARVRLPALGIKKSMRWQAALQHI
jgi:hypothetical protein